jgi:hypothetical protein
MYFAFFIVGVSIGSVLTVLATRKRPIGTLRIDRSDPNDQPYMFLELYKNVGDIGNQKQVTLDVSNENYLSQK